jgi:hypothetical protein
VTAAALNLSNASALLREGDGGGSLDRRDGGTDTTNRKERSEQAGRIWIKKTEGRREDGKRERKNEKKGTESRKQNHCP